MLEELFQNAETATAIIIGLNIIWIVIVIALIICVFNISIRQSHQDRGQDTIIKLLQNISDQQEDILDELKYLNDSNDIDRQEQEDYTEPNDYKTYECRLSARIQNADHYGLKLRSGACLSIRYNTIRTKGTHRLTTVCRPAPQRWARGDVTQSFSLRSKLWRPPLRQGAGRAHSTALCALHPQNFMLRA